MTICQAAWAKVLRGRLSGDCAVLVVVRIGQGFRGFVLFLVRRAEFAPHLPADIKQQQAAGDQQDRPDLEELLGDQREADAQHGGCDDADEDRFLALVGWKAGRGEADDDGVVAG